MKTSILIVDDHPILREGLKSLISRQPDYTFVGEGENGIEAIEKVLQLTPDIVIMDIVMPRLDGILATERIKKSSPGTKVLILSMYHQKEYAMRAFRAGAEGYLLKNNVSERLFDAVQSVRDGNRYISPDIAEFLIEASLHPDKGVVENPFDSLSSREKEVLRFLVEGKTNKEIAENLCLSIATIKTHRNSLMKKLKVHNIASLVKLALKKGMVSPSE